MAFHVWTCFIFTSLFLSTTYAYFFEDGFNHHYTYSADSNIFGEKNVTTVLKFHIRPVNATYNGYHLHFLEVDSMVQFTTDGLYRDNPMNWDLSKHFLFETADHGTIDMVHIHPEDKEELLIIKKALASLFSVKVQFSDDNTWKYNTTENDHFGEMNHEYTATKTATGMTLKRHHYSTHEGHRRHEKVLHYDHKGILHAATANDNVVLKETQPRHIQKPPAPGEYVHKIDTSGKFPEIHVSAQVHVKLEAKRYHDKKTEIFDGLTTDTLHTKRKKEQKRMSDVSSKIQKYTDCFENITDITDANRSACIQNLRMTLLSMQESDYRDHVESMLNRTCDPKDKKCHEKRLVYVDLVAHTGDKTSQEIILKEVLNIPDPVLDEIRRVFIHCIVIMQPTQKFIQAIERFCVGKENSLHGSTNLTMTQTWACLALGSLANNIAKYDISDAERLVKKIETWIQKHKQVNATLRVKRSVPLTELSNDEEGYIMARSALIHSLGNAALKRSLPHIIAHTHPNPVHTAWKRAAVTALRQYTCNESALALFESALYDKDETVRKMAMEQYKKHPMSNTFSAQHRDIILRRNYNYPSLVRLKRSIFDKILLDFKIEIPSLNWVKVLGSEAIGASFGIIFENRLRTLIRPLSGFVDVHIHDKLFAEAHIGILHKHYDILLIEACYKGRLEYNMNIFKDFSVNLARDSADAFDHAIKRMMKPMVSAANNVGTVFQDGDNSKRKPLFEPFANAVKDIPNLTRNALDAVLNLTDTVNNFRGLPWMTKFKETVDSAQSLVEDVNSDAMSFYNQISDAATVGLPFAEKEVSDATDSALKLIPQIAKSPRESFQAIEEARLKYQLGMARMLQSNSIIRETTSLLKGDKSSWISVGGEIADVITMLKNAHNKLQQKSRKRRNAGFLGGFKQQFQDFGLSIEDGMTSVQKGVDSLIGHLEGLQKHSPKTFQKASDSRQLASETMQAGFEAFKQAVEKVKSTIRSIFGKKFHKTFPNQKTGCDSECGCGTYPTERCKKYNTPGIDLIWISDDDWKIPCPVSAMVTKQDKHTLILVPTEADLSDYEIIISNIKPDLQPPKNNGAVYVEAGKTIGISAGKNGCKDDHIHLAMRKRNKDHGGCFYLDPSPFLDSVEILPKWTQICKDFNFKHIGKVFDFGALTAGFIEQLKELAREAVKYAAGLAMKTITESGLIPPGLMSSVKGFMDIVEGLVTGSMDIGQLFNNIGEKMKDFFGKIKIGDISLNGVINMIHGSGININVPALGGAISNVFNILHKPPAGLLKNCGAGLAGKLLAKFSLPKIGGKLASLSLIKASASKLCPSFKNGLSRGFGHACSAEDDCLGVVCEIVIPIAVTSVSLKAGFHVDLEALEIKIFAQEYEKIFSANRNNEIWAPGIEIMGFTIKFQLTIIYHHLTVDISATAIICKRHFCIPNIPILKHLLFDPKLNKQSTSRASRSIITQKRSALGHGYYYTKRLTKRSTLLGDMSMTMMSSLLSNLNQNTNGFVDHMSSMRDSVRSTLCQKPRKPSMSFSTQLSNPKFKTDAGSYPKPGMNSEVSITFFYFIATYPVGPFLFKIEFTAGGTLGTTFKVHVDSVESSVKAVFTPWVAGTIEADLSVSVLIAEGGINLFGYIMKTQFPLSLEVAYGKLPVKRTIALDLELIPLELKLTAYVKILYFINIDKTIWHWRAPSITCNIFKKIKIQKDDSKPVFQDCPSPCRKRRTIRMAPTTTCVVRQLRNRHPVDTSFSLEVPAEDDMSDLTLHYSVGKHPGGQDVMGWTKMSGSTQVVPAQLPNGVPLFWTVSVKNSQGLISYAQCKLDTYDNTFPDGRVQASHEYTSHPHKLSATIVVFEDSPLELIHNISVGYTPGSHGREVRDDEPFYLDATNSRSDVRNELKYFSVPRSGKMTVNPFYSIKKIQLINCAQECLKYGKKCVSFDFELHTDNCDLHQVIEGPNSKLRVSGSYHNYERLDIGFSSYKEYNLALEHGARYYINTHIYNTMGYHSYLLSKGTLVDFTPPETGPIQNAIQDIFVTDGCKAAITQRCKEVTWKPNHRKIIDGPGSKTVFNGQKPLQDVLYSMANNYISANWDGFHDDESGIWGYTWAAGTSVCGSDIAAFSDPFSNLASPKFWTYTGFAKDIVLPDGKYYVTTQAINSVVHGGAMVTTLCHATPITIDTSPPIVHEVSDLLFDEDFDMLGVYYNVSDTGSDISRVDFGLGKTKYDVMVRSYTHHAFMHRTDAYLVIEDLRLKPGVQAWVRLRAVNKVDLFTASHGNQPILIDRTPPVIGHVYDGDQLKVDFIYQANKNEICAQWLDFFDAESGIARFLWGVGKNPNTDDIIQFKTFPYDVKSSCSPALLQHNTSYFSTVIAYNRALNEKYVTAVSNGVLVDETAPIPGWIHDGGDTTEDISYSSSTGTIKSVWGDFSDPESEIAAYSIKVYINEDLRGTFNVGTKTSFTDHSIASKHRDTVVIQLEVKNGAGLKIVTRTDGFIIDETAPLLIHFDGMNKVMYQSDQSTLNFKWEFIDSESQLKEYRYTIYMEQGGSKQKIIPVDKSYASIDLRTSSTMEYVLHLEGLSLSSGARYYIQVTALNNALVSTLQESRGIIIDTTHPVVNNLLLAMPGEEEELDDDGKLVVHIKGEILHVSWHAMDDESSIVQSSLCLKLKDHDCSKDTDFRSVGKDLSSQIDSAMLDVTDKAHLYSVLVKVVNGAKLSTLIESKYIIVIKGDVAGTVFDGRNIYKDQNVQRDKSSLAISFTGFESEACGISGFEWGIGTSPFYTDILSYTDYGLVVSNSSSGFAQIHNTNFDGVKYFASVRAKTGSNCPRDYVVSSSDGIIVDSIPPAISFSYVDDQVLENNHYSLLNSSSSGVFWKASDNVDIASYEWKISNMPTEVSNFIVLNNTEDNLNINKGSVTDGDTRFLIIRAVDNAGNVAKRSSAPVTYDSSEPFIKNLICSDVVSNVKSIVKCSWDVIGDLESTIRHFSIAVGTERFLYNIASPQNVSLTHQTWNLDIGDQIPKDADKMFITITLLNKVQLVTRIHRQVIIDRTPPTMGAVNIITTIGHQKKPIPQRCQIPTSYIDIAVTGFQDKESGIERYEASIGKMKGGANVQDFVSLNLEDGIGSLKNLYLVEGTTVFVSLRIYNKAGLYLMTSTEPVSISPNPQVLVTDGSMSSDQDAQNDLTVMQGHWSYSHPCPALKVEWAIEDLAHNIIKKFESIPDKGYHFYNDELSLENMKTYINVVRVVDAMNRTRVGRSNGISVQIQPPYPGFVKDGLGEDINFQHSANTLSANWGGFGNSNSKKPSQNIVHYEVAAGNDRRYPDTRVNIQYFQNVGLNQSVTFYNLELTKKTQTYYITVRAYSAAGSFQEVYSNGVNVGFTGELLAGTIECHPFQSSTDHLGASWSGIYSDIGIRAYHIGISTHPQPNVGRPFLCDEREDMNISANEHEFINLGLDHIHTFTGLSLLHGLSYTVVLIAHDESGNCIMMESQPITIDTTPPTAGSIEIEGTISEEVMYSNFHNKLKIYLAGFEDKESDIEFFVLALEEGQQCTYDGHFVKATRRHIASQKLVHANWTIFHDISLQPHRVYYISVDAHNQAGLKTSILSKPIKIDDSSPAVGTVHQGTNWKQSKHFQNSTNVIHATLAISLEHNLYVCEDDMHLNNFQIFDNKQFTKSSVVEDTRNIHLILSHDSSLKGIKKGGVSFQQIKLAEGKYTVNIKHAVGSNIITGVSYTSQGNYIQPGHIVDVFHTNDTGFAQNSSSFAYDLPPFIMYGYNFGVLIQQSKISEKIYHGIMWVQDKFKLHYYKIQLDPEIQNNEFKFVLWNKTIVSMSSWDVVFFHNGQESAVVNGLMFDDDINLDIFTWNLNGFIPPVMDPFHPFKTEAVVKNVKVPKPQKPLCMYGAPFLDYESGLKEIWIGLSDSKNKSANVVPFQLYSSYCRQCDRSCEPDCQDTCHLPRGFIPHTLQLGNLSLASASQTKVNSTSAFGKFNLPGYFVDIKVINHAGLPTYAKSDFVLVDSTPPEIEYVKCVNSSYSTEPIEYLGNKNSVSVIWDVDEDVSGIVSTVVSIGTSFGKKDIYSEKVVMNTSFTFDGLNGKLSHMHKYFVNVKVENGAGLKSVKSCNFTMDLLPPDTRNTSTDSMFPVLPNTIDKSVVLTNFTDRIGVKWDKTSVIGVEYYEWMIGSSLEGHDIFPMTRTGNKEAQSVAIVAGEIILGGMKKNPTFGEFFKRDMTNIKTTNSPRKKDFFNMEPGRCVYQSLFAVSRSHLHSKIHVAPSCIKRTKDKLIKPGKERLVEADNGELLPNETINIHDEIHRLSFDFEVDDGGLSVGILDNTDVQGIYGSTASATYSPYIVDPDLTSDQLSRFLKQRVVSMMKPMFYIAPIVKVSLWKKINVTNPFDRNSLKSGTEVALIYWDNGDQLWRSVQEPCGLETGVSSTATLFKTEVCENIFRNSQIAFVKEHREKRNIKSQSSPRQFMIAIIDSSVSNSIPFIVTTKFVGKEDQDLKARIEFSDADGDTLIFSIKTPPTHGTANVSHDGILHYVPELDFTGVDYLEISAKEVIDAPAVTPHEFSTVISINVENVNDAPTLFFQNLTNNLLNSKETEQVDIELTNEHTNDLVGTFWLTDIDSGDNMSYYTVFPDETTINFTLVPPPSTPEQEDVEDIIVNSFGTITRQQLWMEHLPNYTGSTNVSFIIVDRDNAYSRPIIVQVHIKQHVDGGLTAIIIAVIVVCCIIVLALIAAVSFRYYMNSKNKIRDLSALPDNVAEINPNVVYTQNLAHLQAMFQLRKIIDHKMEEQAAAITAREIIAQLKVDTPAVPELSKVDI